MTNFCTHDLDFGDMDMTDVIRVLRTLDEKFQERIAGISGTKILLRCKDEESFARWVKAWKELTD